MSTRNPIQSGLEIFAKQHGFARRKSTWGRPGSDIVGAIGLQKSQFGAQYYVNIGLWIRALGDDPTPDPTKCHITGRLDLLFESAAAELSVLLDLEMSMPDEVRSDRISALLEKTALPFFRSTETEAGLRAAYASGTLKTMGLRAPAIEVLGSTRPN